MTAEAEAPEAPPEEAAPEQINAVVVTRVEDEAGNITVDVSHLGDVKLTEVQTILELGIKRFRELALGQKSG